MPKDRPKMAGTMMKTKSSVIHKVKEMPNSMHSRLLKGEIKGPIFLSFFQEENK